VSHLRRSLFVFPLALTALLAPLAFARAPLAETPDVAVAAVTVVAPLPRTEDKPPLRFTGIPTANTSDLEAKYKPLATYLGEKLGVKFEYVPSADYNASVDGFVNGDLLLCWFGGLTGVRARERVAGARVIVCGKIDREFKSYFIANKSLGLAKSNDFPMALKGKKFTFGSDSSTSGRLMPEYYIRKLTKMTPKEFFGTEMNFSGGHDKTAKLVEAGTFEAGVLDFTQYDKMVAEFKKDPQSPKGLNPELAPVIWVTPNYVDYNFTAHPKVDEVYGKGFTDRLQAALLELKDEALLKALDRPDGLVKATNEDFESVRTLAKEVGLVR
jgi:phosphonate transport system substrate-binding protein